MFYFDYFDYYHVFNLSELGRVLRMRKDPSLEFLSTYCNFHGILSSHQLKKYRVYRTAYIYFIVRIALSSKMTKEIQTHQCVPGASYLLTDTQFNVSDELGFLRYTKVNIRCIFTRQCYSFWHSTTYSLLPIVS